MKKLTRKTLADLAKTMPIIEETLQMEYVGGGSGTSADPYTQIEFDGMMSKGSWHGGYVQGYGFVADDRGVVYGNSARPGDITQNSYSYPNFIRSLSESTSDFISKMILDLVPGVSIVTAVMDKQIHDLKVEMLAKLSEMGYNRSSSFDFTMMILADGSFKFSAIDQNTGRLVISKTLNSWGF